MNSAICTLFENNYHMGLAILVNSLFANGYRGTVYAGYRGALPPWINGKLSDGPGGKVYQVAADCDICFIFLDTDKHFSHLKPDFMLQLLEQQCVNNDALFYFDPDIVVRCRWSFFEEWVACGIAVCEDPRSPIYEGGPQRTAWRQMFESQGLAEGNKSSIYVNAGFVGLRREDSELLSGWVEALEVMKVKINTANQILMKDPAYAFSIPDQDALNIALFSTTRKISFMNKQAMGFEAGGFVMCHAIGTLKPWRDGMFVEALKGRIPMILEADKEFVKYADGPIRLYAPHQLKLKRWDRWWSTFIGKLRS